MRLGDIAASIATARESSRLQRPAAPRCLMHFGADRCTALRPCPCALEQSSHETPELRPFHPLRKSPYRSDWSMLVAMRAHSPTPLPIPECSSAVATTPPTAPSVFKLVYSEVIRCERVPVTTVIGNLDGGTLAAAVSARERNNSRTIDRNHAPATTKAYALFGQMVTVYSGDIVDTLAPKGFSAHSTRSASVSGAVLRMS